MNSNYMHQQAEGRSPRPCRKKKLTTVRLLLVRLVLAVGGAVTRQRVVNTVSVPTLKLVNVVTCGVQS